MLDKFIPMFQYVLMVAFNRFSSIKSQKGVTMIEYALIGVLVSVAVIIGLTLTGTELKDLYEFIGTSIENAVGSSG